MKSHPEIRSVPFNLRADFNASLVLQQYFPKSHSIVKRQRRPRSSRFRRGKHERTETLPEMADLQELRFAK